jgi:hypothetical protein
MHLGMDWSLLIGLVIFLVVAGVASFYLYVFIVRTKNEFRAAQPDLRIANLSAMNSGDVLTLYPELENVGAGVAYDCVMHLGGWEGNFAVCGGVAGGGGGGPISRSRKCILAARVMRNLWSPLSWVQKPRSA